MKTVTNLQFTNQVLIYPFIFIFVIWFVYWIEIKFSLNFTKYGLLPRKMDGLKGVIFSPFIHSDTNHLFNNSIPLGVLFSALIYFYKDVFLKIIVYGGIFTGLLTWVFAREAYHIGASGIVYLLFSFVFFSGIIKKQFQLVAVSLIVIFLYGSMVWYMLPIKEGISWEGHLSGFIVGLIYAFIYRHKGIIKQPYEYIESDFDLLFDEKGNYIPEKEIEEDRVEE